MDTELDKEINAYIEDMKLAQSDQEDRKMNHEALLQNDRDNETGGDYWFITCKCGWLGHPFTNEESAQENMADHVNGDLI